MNPAFLSEARRSFHKALLDVVLKRSEKGVPSNADKDSKLSVALASGVMEKLGVESVGARLAGQTSGSQFEVICRNYLELTFLKLGHLRPGQWEVRCVGGRNRMEIARYEQYGHLAELETLARQNPEIAAALGNEYTITPDLIIARTPETDEFINATEILVDDEVASRTALRLKNNTHPLLHASISCKWTLRSDRAQNARSEALNLIRNRKGHLPHIAIITAEPLPSRISSLALGTGDVDCVYHFALTELLATAGELGNEEVINMLTIMVDGKRLKDIGDLPLDLAI